MAVQVDSDLERGFAQLYEIQKRFLNGSLSPCAARQPLQDIIEGKFAEPASGLDRFTPNLLNLETQLNLLSEFNSRFWNNQLSEEQFEVFEEEVARLDSADAHQQSVDDLEILYVDFGSPEQNVEMWWKVIAGTQPNAWRWDSLQTDAEHLRLAGCAKQYEPGIHRVRLNLVAHWDPQAGRSVDQVRDQAARQGKTLAHAEVLAAYGLHGQLLRQMDGQNLPYADLAGYECTVPGDRPWAYVPYLNWNGLYRGVYLYANWADHVSYYWAAPVVRDCSQVKYPALIAGYLMERSQPPNMRPA